MTDKEFKRLSRSQLIDVIYELQLKQEELMRENETLQQALADKRIRVDQCGSIAEAALGIYNVLQDAQKAAEHYLEEVQLRVDAEHQRILREARVEAEAIISQAQREASAIIAQAQMDCSGYDPVVEAILREYGYDQSGMGEE